MFQTQAHSFGTYIRTYMLKQLEYKVAYLRTYSFSLSIINLVTIHIHLGLIVVYVHHIKLKT